MCAHARPCISILHCVHRVITVSSIVTSFIPHLFTSADEHILFLLSPLATDAVSVDSSGPSFIMVSATSAAAAAAAAPAVAAVLVVASFAFSALTVATLSPSSSDRSSSSPAFTALC